MKERISKVGEWWDEHVPGWLQLLVGLILLYLAVVNQGGLGCRGC